MNRAFIITLLLTFAIVANAQSFIHSAYSSLSSEYARLLPNESAILCAEIKKQFGEWNKKDEFEKIATYNERLEKESVFKFEDICQEVIENYIKENVVRRFSMELSRYDAEDETFMLKLQREDVRFECVCKLQIPIDRARRFKECFEDYDVNISDESTWALMNNMIVPKTLVLSEDGMYMEDGSVVENDKYTIKMNEEDAPFSIPFSSLDLTNQYLQGYTYNYGQSESGDEETVYAEENETSDDRKTNDLRGR